MILDDIETMKSIDKSDMRNDLFPFPDYSAAVAPQGCDRAWPEPHRSEPPRGA